MPQTQLDVHVIDEASKESLANATLALGGTLRLVTDLSGKAIFHGLSPRIYRLDVRADGYAERKITVDTSHQKRIEIEPR